MSSDYLKLVPLDPNFVPEGAAQRRAIAALENLLPDGSECEARDFGHVAFIDQGENLEAIICPACSERLPLYGSPTADANEEWLNGIFDKVQDGDVSGISVVMP